MKGITALLSIFLVFGLVTVSEAGNPASENIVDLGPRCSGYFINVAKPDPDILPADEKSTTDIVATVTTCGGDPVAGDKVRFSISPDEMGSFLGADPDDGTVIDITDSQGKAEATYIAGASPGTATITATDISVCPHISKTVTITLIKKIEVIPNIVLRPSDGKSEKGAINSTKTNRGRETNKGKGKHAGGNVPNTQTVTIIGYGFDFTGVTKDDIKFSLSEGVSGINGVIVAKVTVDPVGDKIYADLLVTKDAALGLRDIEIGEIASEEKVLTVFELKIVSFADLPLDCGGLTTWMPVELTAKVEPNNISGTFAWSESSPKISIDGPANQQTVTIKGDEVSDSENDAIVTVRFTPDGSSTYYEDTFPLTVYDLQIQDPTPNEKETLPNINIKGTIVPGTIITWKIVIDTASPEEYTKDSLSGSSDVLACPLTWPTSNSGFGLKEIEAKKKFKPASWIVDVQSISLFFPEEGTQNPGNSSPNWYYYWGDTPADFGNPVYDGTPHPYGETIYNGTTWVAHIGKEANESATSANGSFEGIDLFADVCRHEAKHVQDNNSWYPNGYEPSLDTDHDGLPDNKEASLGGTPENPINGGPFKVGDPDTDGDGMPDVEDYTFATDTLWTVGTADSYDWANPGHQY